MEDKKTKILELIEELNLDITPDEATASMEKLNEEELQVLVDKYQALANYRNTLEDFAAAAEPEKYKENEEKYLLDLEKTDEEALDRMEKAREETDIKLDAMDAKSEREEEETMQKGIGDMDDAIQIQKESLEIIDKALTGRDYISFKKPAADR